MKAKKNKAVPFERQMMYILRNYQGMVDKLVKCRRERDEYKQKYMDIEPFITECRDIKKRISELNDSKLKKEAELSKLKSCIEAKRNKLTNLNKKLKEVNIAVAEKEAQLNSLEFKIENARLDALNLDIYD